MSDGLKPCPFCGDEHPEITSGDLVICGTDTCFGNNTFSGWNTRTPGPATAYVAYKFMCRMVHEISIGASDGRDNDEFSAIFTNAEARAFIAEFKPYAGEGQGGDSSAP